MGRLQVPANIYYGRTRFGVEVGSARGLGLLVRNPENSVRIIIMMQTNSERGRRAVVGGCCFDLLAWPGWRL